MDPIFRREFFRIIREVIAEEKASIILATHIQEEIEKQMDYVGIMELGKLISFGENR
ncbi:MAG: hypothetical protein ACERKZ_20880 [Lachnotalea sp.]